MSADGVHFDVTERGFPMGVVQHAGVKAALPDSAGVVMGDVAMGGVEAVDVHHEQRDGVRTVTGGDQVEVIRHQGVGGHADRPLFTASFEKVQEVPAIGVAEEDTLFVVAALGDVQPVSGRGEAIFSSQWWSLR